MSNPFYTETAVLMSKDGKLIRRIQMLATTPRSEIVLMGDRCFKLIIEPPESTEGPMYQECSMSVTAEDDDEDQHT